MPPVDIQQSAHHYRLRMELPGVHRDDIRMSYRDGKLSIEGSKQAELKTGHDTWRQQSECLYGRFYRGFLLSGVEHPEHIRAEFNNGLLMVHVPRRSSSASTTLSIDIESWQHPQQPWSRE
jgi:HSP20 family protein